MLELRRAQRVCEAADALQHVLGDGDALPGLRGILAGRVLAQPEERDLERRERLPEIVVQLERDGAALLLLHGEDPARDFLQAPVRVVQREVREHARGDVLDGDDRAARTDELEEVGADRRRSAAAQPAALVPRAVRGEDRAARIEQRHLHGEGIEEALVEEVRAAQRRFGPHARAAQRHALDRGLDRDLQPPEAPLEQVIVRALAHRLHRRVLADEARDHDERQVEAALLAHDRERAPHLEARQVVVAQDHVDRVRIEARDEILLGLHARDRGLERRVAQRERDQLGIVFGVLDEDDAAARTGARIFRHGCGGALAVKRPARPHANLNLRGRAPCVPQGTDSAISVR
jgi:hypothetical protein